MTHGSLFSGIGGFDLAAEWMGWENVFHCEYDPFCQKVLKHHFPNSKLYEDIKTFDATNYSGRIDILTGGFPCQPFSNAGLRKGTEDDRHLWPQMLRVIKEISPRYIVGENVSGLLNWSGGLVFEEVCADLETEGYEVTPFILPAAGKNAPHRRDRIWFVAYRNESSTGTDVRRMPESSEEIRGRKESFVPRPLCSDGDASDTEGGRNNRKRFGKIKQRREKGNKGFGTNIHHELIDKGKVWDAPDTESKRLEGGRVQDRFTYSVCEREQETNWENFPTVPPICGGDDGLPKELDGITFPKWRKESIKAYGNAIVPQVAHEIFKAIQKMEESVVS
jgi:DNA (cytosine-5)-methyltransferase 1